MSKKLFAFISIFLCTLSLSSQSYSPYENPDYLPFERMVYQPGRNFHTSIRQFRFDELEAVGSTDSALYSAIRVPEGKLNIFKRFLYDDLLQWENDDFKVAINPLFNFEGGKETTEGITTFTNTRGINIQGQLGKFFSFYTDVIETQAIYPNYINRFADRYDVIPGYGPRKDFGDNGHDFSQATGYISFNVAKYFNLQIGNGKNFIGDGYRSLLLSDVAYSYPYVKATATFGKVKYQALYSKLLQYEEDKATQDHRFPGKYSVTQYLDVNIGKRLSTGLFSNVTYAAADTTGFRGFDIYYLNPMAFVRPVEYSLGSPDNVTLGFNGKYVAAKWITLYGQFVLGEFKADEVFSRNQWWANKHGFQLGFKTFDLFGVKNLDVQVEYNHIRPYMYSHYTPIYAYSHLQQPMAHILGANCKEYLGILRYKYKRIMFKGQVTIARYGDDFGDGVSWGKDVLIGNTNRPHEYGHYIGQGLTTDVINADVSLSYLVNPRNMLNVFGSVRIRKATSSEQTLDTQWISMGVRTSLKAFYKDF